MEMVLNTKKEILKSLLTRGLFLWNKLYKKEIFCTIRMVEGKKFEDNFIIPQFVQVIDRLGYVNSCLYHYGQHIGSTVHPVKYNQNIWDLIEAANCILDFVKNEHVNCVEYAWMRWANARRQAIETVYNCVDSNEHKKEIKQWQSELRNNFWKIMRLKGYRVKAKVAYILVSLNVDLYMWVKKMVKNVCCFVHNIMC